MKRRREVLGLFALTGVLGAGLILFAGQRDQQQPAAPYQFPAEEFAALDRIVQARFAVVPTDDFGITRIGKRHAVFSPSTHGETTVISALERRNLDIVFYVAGADYLLNRDSRLGPRFLSGPVFISGFKRPVKQNPYSYFALLPSTGELGNPPGDLPNGKSLLQSPLKEPARRALEYFEQAAVGATSSTTTGTLLPDRCGLHNRRVSIAIIHNCNRAIFGKRTGMTLAIQSAWRCIVIALIKAVHCQASKVLVPHAKLRRHVNGYFT